MKSLKYLILSILAILIGIGIYYSVNKKPIDKKVPVAAACSKENEQERAGGCCAGLKSTIDDDSERNGINGYCMRTVATGAFIGIPGAVYYAYCIKCGDGVCGEHEGKCNCPEDCGKPDPSQQKMRDDFLFDGPALTLNNPSYTLDVGEPFLLKLGEDKDWTIKIENPDLLSLGDNPVDKGSQGIYVPVKYGATILTAIGDPPCKKSTPQCQTPSTLFKVNINVYHHWDSIVFEAQNINQLLTKQDDANLNRVHVTGVAEASVPTERDPEGIYLKDETGKILLNMWNLHTKELIGKKLEIYGEVIYPRGLASQLKVLWYKIK